LFYCVYAVFPAVHYAVHDVLSDIQLFIHLFIHSLRGRPDSCHHTHFSRVKVRGSEPEYFIGNFSTSFKRRLHSATRSFIYPFRLNFTGQQRPAGHLNIALRMMDGLATLQSLTSDAAETLLLLINTTRSLLFMKKKQQTCQTT